MNHENKEVSEQPQWVVGILNRLDELETQATHLKKAREYEYNLGYLRNFNYE